MIKNKIVLQVEISESLRNQIEAFTYDYGTSIEHIVSKGIITYIQSINH
jgi:hypothetical protein